MNRILTILIIIFFIKFLFISCTYDNPITPCLDNIFPDDKWKPYRGESLTGQCYWYINHSVWRGDDYFENGGTCVDMISIPQKCDGTFLCFSFSDPILDTFWRETNRLGIVAYK